MMVFKRSSLGTTLTDIANAIYTQEGPTQNNNPGNLLYAGQAGATGKDYRGFAIFSSLAAGQAAEVNQLQLLATRGTCATGAPVNTLADALACLTPPSDNNTAAYIANVSAATGVDPNTSLASLLAGTSSTSSIPDLSSLFGGSDSLDDGLGYLTSIATPDPAVIALGIGAAVLLFLYLRA